MRAASDLTVDRFFHLEGFAHAPLFAADTPVWSALGAALTAYLDQCTEWKIECELPAGVHLLGDRIAIAPGCRIEPGAVLIGPAILEEGVEIRTGAYVRQCVILGRDSLVGAHSEVKGSILLPGAKAPHQAYVGDSILGRGVNLGAGTILSNVKNVGREVSFRHQGERVDTGLRKLGAILGDGCKTGCNTVLNPGVLLGPGCVTYPNTTLRSGFYPADTLIKVRQQQQQMSMERLRRK
jgi:UDP-N-acetylglucosamine diphosphorylase / glucose-1-phosphate thymidylyltransferase / UDP-N-acetylgalactosamine diphosphorylase / glucosamine-1-phosphate N-acetyltransferase / galactosamine-1-phosphate N-acetyltransferase